MPMTPEQHQAFAAWLRTMSLNHPCPACTGLNFDVYPDLVVCYALEVPADGPAHRNFKRGVPLVAITCANCGHVRLFNAAAIGVLSAGRPGPRPTEPAPPAVGVPMPTGGDGAER